MLRGREVSSRGARCSVAAPTAGTGPQATDPAEGLDGIALTLRLSWG